MTRTRRLLLAGAVGSVVLGVAGGWLIVRGREARAAVAQLQVDGATLQRQLLGYDLAGAGPTLTRVRVDAQRAHALTGDPVWGLAAAVPVLGRDLRAAREVSSVTARVTAAAQPLESVLPRLDPKLSARRGGTFDTPALTQVAQALPNVSAAVSAGAVTLGEFDPTQLRPEVATGVVTLNQVLSTARGPLANAVPVIQAVPSMLGADTTRRWMVLLQQDAEARGTGGLVGAYAVLNTNRGRIQLVSAQPRSALAIGPAIPDRSLPAGVRALYGRDLREWAGLNVSPHWPYTGELVAAGWKRQGRPALDYVAGVDQYVVAAMLAGTGPVTVQGVRVDQSNAVDFLSRGVYRRWSKPQDVDRVTTELVGAVFGRFAAGRFDLRALVTAMGKPVSQRRLLVWAADADEQETLSKLTVAGTIPGDAGPFAMAVVNNGGGNKLDAYLRVHTDYQPGLCANDTRTGQISVTLSNTAPRRGKGLPDYVNVRSDLIQAGLTGAVTRDGSNRILLDVYGPVGSTAALTTLDGRPLAPVVGLGNNHTVWRVAVPIDAGQRRTVTIVMTAPAVDGDVGSKPVVLSQPMVQPATVSSTELTKCVNSSAPRENREQSS